MLQPSGGSDTGLTGTVTVERLDVREGVWRAMPKMRRPRSYHPACNGPNTVS